MAKTPTFDLTFYSKCAKPLILQLPTPGERSLASTWLKWLTEDKSTSQSLKRNYMKQLIRFLQKKKLGQPFLTHPLTFQTLPETPQDLNTAKYTQRSRPQPYSIDYSGDLRTYVAYQEIENSGIHCYYAFSESPFPMWNSFDPDLFDLETKPQPAGLSAARLLDDGTDHLKVLDTDLEEKKKDFAEKLEVKIKTEKRAKVKSVMAPLGKSKRRDENEGLHPTWGSNLIHMPDFSEIME